MDILKKQPLGAALAMFVVGLLIGWVGIGWGLWPVEYVDADVAHLRADLQQEYVRLVANAYALDSDAGLATQRMSALGPCAAKVIADTLASPQTKQAEAVRVTTLQKVLEVSGALANAGDCGKKTGGPGNLTLPLLGCGVVVIVLLGLGAIMYFRSASAGRPARPARGGQPASGRGTAEPMGAGYPAPAAVSTPTGSPPVAQFMTTYVLGDDTYDDSFSIDGPDGSFLGECGMGLSETIGVGDPKKVTAFEVWLFDKNDIRTVTKVLMSEHAFRDEALKSRLAAKGEPVMLRPGDSVAMETATLVVTARVVDMAYGGGSLPPNSFFERLTIELACFQKPPAA